MCARELLVEPNSSSCGDHGRWVSRLFLLCPLSLLYDGRGRNASSSVFTTNRLRASSAQDDVTAEMTLVELQVCELHCLSDDFRKEQRLRPDQGRKARNRCQFLQAALELTCCAELERFVVAVFFGDDLE
jgi:hypothetical protein